MAGDFKEDQGFYDSLLAAYEIDIGQISGDHFGTRRESITPGYYADGMGLAGANVFKGIKSE